MIDELIKYDSSFNEGMFKSYVDNIFVKLYTAIMLDDLDSVKHFISDNVYEKFEDKIKELNKKNLTQMYDELNVKSSEIVNVEITDDEFIITVRLVSRYMDYLINKDTGNFVSGNNSRRVERNNTLIFKKNRGFKNQKKLRRCPGCGASIDVNSNGICEYCGTTYNLEKYDYILCDINTY